MSREQRTAPQVADADQHEVILQAASADYDRAGEVMDQSREALYAAIRQSVAGGMSRYRAAQVAGLSQPMVAKIVQQG